MGEQDGVAGHVLNSSSERSLVMKGFAVRLLSVLTVAITAGLVWLPSVAQAGLTVTGVD
jgi:hypothetical protein